MKQQTPLTTQEQMAQKIRDNRNSQVYTGLFILLVGVGILLRRMDTPIPDYFLSWKTLLIAVGLFIGFKNSFKDLSWLIPITIGTVFLLDDLVPGWSFRRIGLPIGIIIVGLVVVYRGWQNNKNRAALADMQANVPTPANGFVSGFKRLDEQGNEIPEPTPTPVTAYSPTAEDELELVAVFGGVKRSVVSKHFRGGEITAILGGAEVDLTNADIQGVVHLEATNILGGSKLIVPAHWDVQSEMVAIFGGVEDKRIIRPEMIDRSKKLILSGTCLLGGLEIKSF